MAFPLANTHIQISSTALLEQYQQQMLMFLHYAELVSSEHEIEAIHELRVSIKNLRACLTLFELCSKEIFNKHAHFDLLAPLFKKAGRIRETQINLILIDSVSSIQPFKNHLLKLCAKYSKRLAEEINHFDFKSLSALNETLSTTIQPLGIVHISSVTERFLREKWSDAIEVMQEKRNVKSLHELRCTLKVIREILVILGSVTHDKDIIAMHQQLKIMHGKIGEWHDREVLQLAIRSYLQNHRDEDLKRFLDKFAQKTKARRSKLWLKAENLFN